MDISKQPTNRDRHKFSREITEQISMLYTYDYKHGCVALIQVWGTIALLLIIAYHLPRLVPAVIVMLGMQQRALATILHECAHNTFFTPRKPAGRIMNKISGTLLSGFWIFQTYYRYKESHVMNHHHYLGDLERDPDVNFYASQGLLTEEGRRDFLKRHFLPMVLGIKTLTYIRYLIANRLFNAGADRASKSEHALLLLFWTILLSLSVLNPHSLRLIMVWMLSYLWSFQIIGWIIEICEHYPLTCDYHIDLKMSRNRLGNRLENCMFGILNENYHLVHHLFPGIPFWLVPRAHIILLSDPQYAYISSESGGIFTRGVLGGEPILRQLFRVRVPYYSQT